MSTLLAQPGTLARDPAVDRSLRHSLWDGVFFSAMIGCAESYFAAFGVFLRASTAQIGILASLPPLLGASAQLLSAWLGRRLGRRRAIIVAGALIQAGALLPLALLPALFPAYAVPLLILCAVAYFAGPNLGSPQWGSMMGDLVPESRRGRFFALRTRYSSMASFSALIVAGLVLAGAARLEQTYLGFALIFGLAALARLASTWHLAQMLDPPGHVAAIEMPWHAEFWRAMRSTGLLRFTLFFASMQFAVALASPYFALYMLRDLQWGYVAFMFNAAASLCVQFLTLARWGRLSDLFGNRLILVTTGLLIPVLPTLWMLSTHYAYLLAVQALSGLCWAGFTLSATNAVFDLTPRERRVTIMAVHNVFGAIGVFLGALVGGWLGTHLPVRFEFGEIAWSWTSPLLGVFLISTLVRFAVAGAFLRTLREQRRVRPMTRRGLIFRVTRIQPLSGLVFEIVGRRRSPPP
ncbi:MAG: MFS transporter [Pseudomonadales bacterium]|jgi:MFS family permease|nr:MFS transporter [Pseudomonadales bacterium]